MKPPETACLTSVSVHVITPKTGPGRDFVTARDRPGTLSADRGTVKRARCSDQPVKAGATATFGRTNARELATSAQLVLLITVLNDTLCTP